MPHATRDDCAGSPRTGASQGRRRRRLSGSPARL